MQRFIHNAVSVNPRTCRCGLPGESCEGAAVSSKFKHRVSAADDDLHEVRLDIPLWSESALITCHDPATGISVYGHLVLLENEEWESIFSVYLPNGEILTDRSYSRP